MRSLLKMLKRMLANSPIQALLIGTLAVGIGSCSTSKPQPMQIFQTIRASERLNPNVHEISRPVYIDVFFLNEIDAFEDAKVEQLIDNPTAALGNSMIKKSRYFVKPGSEHDIRVSVPEGSRFLAVFANFRHADSAADKTFVPLPQQNGTKHNLTIQLQGFQLSTRFE
ncbi:Uncharacterised protein [BD1-7 clade bacterium]|uniref:Type VI secretion system-associated lipoprotein n=1 Tax=BD1-7 clade bacterium TaxID=2029982 RepID=A0A5S9QX64_9GAMM|nr:Uncharacterised protein [BD1-7 clade bacterium]